jgi:hypothetical protein
VLLCIFIWQRKLFSIHGDLGDGQCIFEWSPRGNLIAAAGNKVNTKLLAARKKLGPFTCSGATAMSVDPMVFLLLTVLRTAVTAHL